MLLCLCTSAACGTTADAGSDRPQPVSGAGPFRCLPRDDRPCTAPTVILSDPGTDYDDPAVFADGEALGLWLSARSGGRTRIAHADATSLAAGFDELQTQLTATETWEGADVSAPSLVRPEGEAPWLLFYLAGGAIGYATSADGHEWTKAPGPALTADNSDNEGGTLGAPAAARVGDRIRVYYVAKNLIWAAEAPVADFALRRAPAWSRLDGEPGTAARDPMISIPPYATALGRPFARVVITPAGRVRHDLYFTVHLPRMDIPTSAAYAASYTGDRFAVAAAPILTLVSPASRAPSAAPLPGGTFLLLVAQRAGAHDGIAAAVSP